MAITASTGSEAVSATLADGRVIHGVHHPGTGEPLVLLHGLLDSAAGWSEFAAAQTRPCYAFDLPGFGRSDLPARSRLSAYAKDIADAIALLSNPTPFAVVAHSFGGAVAAALSERIPDSISSMFLIAPAGFGRIRLAEAVSIPGVRQVTERALPLALGHRLPITIAYRGFVTNNVAPDRKVVERIIGADAKVVAAAACAADAIVAAGISDLGFHRRRLRYRGPVTALWGKRDMLVPAPHSRGVRTAFPQAQIVKWPGMGHHPQRERFDDLIALAAEATRPPAPVIPISRAVQACHPLPGPERAAA
jgi:pyruvate dehydrogenase E2 component (dihydrolipoamide acetyltransferase)